MPATYEPIASTTLGTAASSITLSSIPGTYTDLVAVLHAPGPALAVWTLQVNSDAGSNYSRTFLFGTGSAAGSGRSTSVTSWPIGAARTDGMCVVQLMSYANTNVFKTVLWNVGSALDDLAPIVGLYRSTSAITSLTFGGPTYPTGTTLSLYGIKAA